jgi:hypothetical protein
MPTVAAVVAFFRAVTRRPVETLPQTEPSRMCVTDRNAAEQSLPMQNMADSEVRHRLHRDHPLRTVDDSEESLRGTSETPTPNSSEDSYQDEGTKSRKD